MGKIKNIIKVTENPFLNFYDLSTENKVGREGHYYVASRAKTEEKSEDTDKKKYAGWGSYLQPLRRKGIGSC